VCQRLYDNWGAEDHEEGKVVGGFCFP